MLANKVAVKAALRDRGQLLSGSRPALEERLNECEEARRLAQADAEAAAAAAP